MTDVRGSARAARSVPAARHLSRSRALAVTLVSAIAAITAMTGCGAPSGQTTVRVFALWTGQEEAAFRRVLDRFHDRTGITVEYTGGLDVPAALAEAVRKGDPPDVAVLSDPGSFRGYLAQHALKPLDGVVGTNLLDTEYPQLWRTIMRGGSDRTYAVVVKATLKSLIWYDPAVFRARNLQVPQTWDALLRLERQSIQSGVSPWCLGLESGPASGWPGTDWIEDILLHQSGPAVYSAWAQGSLPWTSAPVRRAWQTWGQIVATPGAVNGGAGSALVTNFAAAGTPMQARRPGCLMDHQASFIMANYSGATTADGRHAQAGRDFDLMPFPQIDARYANALEVGADLAGLFTDTPAGRQLIAFLASPEAQQIWPSIPGSGALSVNTAVPLAAYPDRLTATMARMITGRAPSTTGATAPISLSFDASDQMPTPMQNAFYQAVLQYTAHPDQLGELLADLEQIRAHSGS